MLADVTEPENYKPPSTCGKAWTAPGEGWPLNVSVARCSKRWWCLRALGRHPRRKQTTTPLRQIKQEAPPRIRKHPGRYRSRGSPGRRRMGHDPATSRILRDTVRVIELGEKHKTVLELRPWIRSGPVDPDGGGIGAPCLPRWPAWKSSKKRTGNAAPTNRPHGTASGSVVVARSATAG